MRCFWDERQRAHKPAAEFFNGGLHPAAEHDGRVDAVLASLGSTETPVDLGMEPVRRVHGDDYLDLLRDAHDEWLAAGREGDAFPYTFPIVGRRPLSLSRIDARLGQHSFDTSTPIGPGSGRPATGASRRRWAPCPPSSRKLAPPLRSLARPDIMLGGIISAAIPI